MKTDITITPKNNIQKKQDFLTSYVGDEYKEFVKTVDKITAEVYKIEYDYRRKYNKYLDRYEAVKLLYVDFDDKFVLTCKYHLLTQNTDTTGVIKRIIRMGLKELYYLTDVYNKPIDVLDIYANEMQDWSLISILTAITKSKLYKTFPSFAELKERSGEWRNEIIPYITKCSEETTS